MKEYKALFWVVLLSVIPFLTFVVFYIGFERRSRATYNSFANSKKKLYCYETYSGPPNPVQFVKEDKDIDSLKVYYDKIEHGNLSPIYNFPTFFMPVNQKVYVLSYYKDSTIAKIRFYYHDDREEEMTGYVYARTLHSDSTMVRRKQ